MKPKKEKINAAVANGSFERIDILLSAAQQLIAEAHCMVDESIEILEMNDLMRGEIHQVANNYMRAAERYFQKFAELVANDEKKMAMFRDMDSFDKVFREWSNIPKQWEPKEVSDETCS